MIISLIWNLEKIYTPEEQKERAAKALSLNGITMEPETETELFPQLRAASSSNTNIKKKPTVRVNRLGYNLRAAPPQRQQTKLKAAASQASVQIASVVPSHEISREVAQSLDPNKKTLVIRTSCLGCGAKATQVLHFQAGKEMRPSKNSQILPKLCQACKGDMYCEYSGSALT
jgi:hypothetical protein